MADATQFATLSTASAYPLRTQNGNSAPDAAPQLPAAAAGQLIASVVTREESYHAARDRVIQQFEKQYLLHLMNRTRGNLTEAARIAAVNRTTLYRMMERNGLQRAPSLGWLVEVDG